MSIINIIGNVKIQKISEIERHDPGYVSGRATIEDRFSFLLASIRSYSFLKEHGVKFILNVSFGEIDFLQRGINRDLLYDALKGFDYTLSFKDNETFSSTMQQFISKSDSPYYLHFEEDHFCELDDLEYWKRLEDTLITYQPDIVKASHWLGELKTFEIFKPRFTTNVGNIYLHTNDMANEYAVKVWARWYLGTNCIFSREFGLKFWSRTEISWAKHPIEIPGYREDFLHTALIPNREIQRYIDDDHGIPNSCCWMNPSEKWKRCYIDYTLKETE